MPSGVRGISSNLEIEQLQKHGLLECVHVSHSSLRFNTTQSKQALQTSLVPLSLDQQIVQSLCPVIRNPELLKSMCYQGMFEQAKRELAKTAEQMPPEQRPMLQAIFPLLEEWMELQDMLNAYRNVLHQA